MNERSHALLGASLAVLVGVVSCKDQAPGAAEFAHLACFAVATTSEFSFF